MRLSVTPLLIGLTVVATAPASAQLRASRPTRPVQNNPRLMVANPHSFAAADSAAAVRVGAGMREKITDIADKWYTTVQRNQMNDALVQYGYPPDAVLPPLVARQLATQLQSRAFVSSTLARGEDGRVTIEARVLAGNDQTGFIVRRTQEANQSFEDLGKAIAEDLKPVFNAMEDAKECNDLRDADPKKAKEAAAKALKTQPNYGKAELCLALIALSEKAPAAEIISHFKNAVEGDRLSLEAWGGLLGQYQAANDTTQIIETYRQILRVAPTNQTVREEALKSLIALGYPQVGEEVADEGLALDPNNPDILILKSRACIVQGKPEKFDCAIQALEQVYALDSTKADTSFYQMILYAASQDSTKPGPYVKWAKNASEKFSSDTYFLSELVRAYGYAGDVDNVVSSTKRLLQLDTTDMQPLLRAVLLLNGKASGLRAKADTARQAGDSAGAAQITASANAVVRQAIDVGASLERYGQETDIRNFGVLLAQAGLGILQSQPVDFVLAEEVGRKASSLLGASGGRASQLAHYVLGIGLIGKITPADQAAVEAKSCEAVDALENIVTETVTALKLGREIQPGWVDERVKGISDSYGPRIAQMRKAYCK